MNEKQEKSMPAVELEYVKKIADRLHRALDRFVDEQIRRNGGTDG